MYFPIVSLLTISEIQTKLKMDDEKIDITGLDKRDVLVALWEKSKVAGFYQSHDAHIFGIRAPTTCSEKEVSAVLDSEHMCADYVDGRVIKTCFKGDSLNPWGYDRDNGKGAMKAVVDALRAKQKQKQ
jgi:hypothetical protein